LSEGGPESGKGRKEKIQGIIPRAGRWIADRFDGTYITGNETKTDRALVYTTWGLRALAQTYTMQDERVQRLFPDIVESYLNAIRSGISNGSLAGRQEYLTILSEDVGAQLYYEDRSGLGGILLTILSLAEIAEIEGLLESLGYSLLLEQVISEIMNGRNTANGLWFNQGLILSIHSYLVEAFLQIGCSGKEIGRKLPVSGPAIRDAVKAVFEDKTIISALQQAVYRQVLRIVEQSEQSKTMASEISKLKPDKRTGARARSRKLPKA